MEPTHYSCPKCGHDNPIANGRICENCMDTYLPLIPVEPRIDPKCTCFRSMTTGKFDYGHQYPCKGGAQ